MIYITGDTHGKIDFNRLEDYFSNIHVTRNDYLIILGDVAIFWNKEENYINDYENLGLTIFYIDGNHENFTILNSFPIIEYLGGKMHKISSNIYHILRGEVFYLDGYSFLGVGGASSIDRIYRTQGISWWEEENINASDISNAIENASKVDGPIDYVLTHCATSFIHHGLFSYQDDNNTLLLKDLAYQIEYKHWYFGHYHRDIQIDEKFRLFYKDIEVIR